jgi:hypothetical protein
MVLEVHFPKYFRFIEHFKISDQHIPCNMYVMPWHLFCSYLDELFAILEKVCNIIGLQQEGYDGRYPGFLAERFLGLYLLTNRVTSCNVPMLTLEQNEAG